MMRRALYICILSFVLLMSSSDYAAQVARRLPPKTVATKTIPSRAPAAQPRSTVQGGDDADLKRALALVGQKNYDAASQLLFNLSRNPKYFDERARIKYILGLVFSEMKLNQVAAFQFVDVIRGNNPKYVRQALQRLSTVADELNDDTLLNYAISKVSIEEFPKTSQDMLRFRIGEFFMRKDKYQQAADAFSKVASNSSFFPKAKYMEGLSLAKSGELNGALKSFQMLAENRKSAGITDTDRVAAIAGMARIAYQQKRWDLAIALYRQVPKDTELWHDALFESSWAHMRAARFRSVLSNLHSLHSPFYEDFYLPESILLRGIVYLYICQYDEMEKTLGLFEKIYQPVQTKLTQFIAQQNDPIEYFKEVEKVIKNFDNLKTNINARKAYKVPFVIVRYLMKEGDFKHSYTYLKKLKAELADVDSKAITWRRAPVGVASRQILLGRIAAAQKVAGNIVRTHMVAKRDELADLFEQYNFGRYEMINGKKEALKRKMQGKTLSSGPVDDNKNRDFYIQNGFQYWPFTGEYWLDELGDYHYLGTQGCE